MENRVEKKENWKREGSSVASPICQEGQKERTFPISTFSSQFLHFFSIYSWFFPSFSQFFLSLSRFLTIFRCQGCPYTGYATEGRWKIENGRRKSYQMRRGSFFFFFFYFSPFKTTEICFGSIEKGIFCRGRGKSRKMTLPPLKNMPLAPLLCPLWKICLLRPWCKQKGKKKNTPSGKFNYKQQKIFAIKWLAKVIF